MAETATKLPITTEKRAAKAVERGWTPFDSLRREVDRLFDDFHPFSWRGSLSRALREVDLPSVMWSVAPAMDLTEKRGLYEITAELPGMDEKNIEVTTANGVLTIKGEKTEETQEEKKDYHLSERRYGSFQRAFRIPEGVEPEKIEANFSKGILTVKLPRAAVAVKNEKKIEIKAA